MESRFNLVLLIVITVILTSGTTYFAISWPQTANPNQKTPEKITQKLETASNQIGWKEYTNEVLAFTYPPEYSITEPGPGTLNAITVAKANTKRLEIFQLKNFPDGDRPWGFETEMTQEDLDGYVPKEFLKITVGKEIYDVWLYYSAADTETKAELHRIADSLKSNSELPQRPQGRAAQQEVLQLLERFGMRTDYREPMYNQNGAVSPDKTMTAVAWDLHNQHYIEVRHKDTDTVQHYIPTDVHGVIEEIGDLHFSPDGKKLAYAAYMYNSAISNDEVLGDALPHVYVIDLATGQQEIQTPTKKPDTIVRITGWKDDEPVIVEESLTNSNRPGEYPTLFIPYNYR